MPIPKREFYSCAELIELWRWWGCNRSMLLELARQDTLLFAVYLRDIGSHQRHEERPDGNYIVTTSVMKFVSSGMQSHPNLARPMKYLSSEDVRRIFEATKNESIAVSTLYHTCERTKAKATHYLQPLYFTADDLIISATEVDRFENSHKLRAARYLPSRFFAWISETSNQRTLGFLGAGIAALAGAAWATYRHFFN